MKSIVAAVLLILVVHVFATETRDLKQSEINEMAMKESIVADVQLNNIYKQLRAKLRDKCKVKSIERLIASQRVWIQFRDAECEFETEEFECGRDRAAVYANAKTRLTTARIEELKVHIESFGDESICEMNQAASEAAKKSDVELNKIYKRILPTLSSESKKDLIRTEKAWLIYRDSAVRLEARQYEGGTIQPEMTSNAFARITEAWVKELKCRENY